ncbi:hypothetical protein LCGC14_0334980 [marine sediment metagenome]|uniref:Uncharacterized protein n=1 Tax=marine sediment metagenome TaxID=412755 RepID=A0A0F9TFI6_9ZZZZ
MSEPRKISRDEQTLRRKVNRLKRTKRKLKTEIWQTWMKIYDHMYPKKPEEDEQ